MKNQVAGIRLFLFFGLLLLITFNIKGQNKKLQVAIIAFYNTENLYDTIDDPRTDDKEFLPGNGIDWNSARYNLKIEHISEAISRIGQDIAPGGPAVIGLAEIENHRVLDDLTLSVNLKSKQYGVVQYDSPDRRGIDVGFLYQKNRFVLKGSRPFALVMSDTSFHTRDQLLVWGKLDGEPIYFLVNHWPSRSGGESKSAPKRAAAATLARHIADSLMKKNPKVKLIIMGDMNDNPTDSSIAKVLNAKGSADCLKAGDLFNPMYHLYKDGKGSYEYRDKWDQLDQTIVSYGLISCKANAYKFSDAKIFDAQFLKQQSGAYAGYPWRTEAGGKYLAGYSDHFPVYLILSRQAKK